MASYDTTATCQEDTWLDSSAPNSTTDNNGLEIQSSAAINDRSIMNFVLPSRPSGVDRIDRIFLTLTRSAAGSATRTYNLYKLGKLWTEASATWNRYNGSGNLWANAGGDTENQITSLFVGLGSTGASVTFELSALGLDWGQRGSVLLRDEVESFAAGAAQFFIDSDGFRPGGGTVGTFVWRPHIVVRFIDDPPLPINDLKLSSDMSLSEASYTFRQRAVLGWTASGATDFKRYRIRRGINRSLAANHTHLTFLNSRASTTYLDTTLYTDGSTIYYSLYPEDRRNGSTSTALGATYVSVSNIASWTKPDAIIGSLSVGSSASTLQEIEVRTRTSDMTRAKKVKVIWGDGGVSYSQTLSSAGGYLIARHRYTKATSGYTIRAQIEDIYGFRSSM